MESKSDLFDGESEARYDHSSDERDEQGDPESRSPREGHPVPDPPSPRPEKLVLLVAVDYAAAGNRLLQRQARPQPLRISQVFRLSSQHMQSLNPLPGFGFVLSSLSLSQKKVSRSLSTHRHRPQSPSNSFQYFLHLRHCSRSYLPCVASVPFSCNITFYIPKFTS